MCRVFNGQVRRLYRNGHRVHPARFPDWNRPQDCGHPMTGRPWTPREDEAIRKHYPSEGSTWDGWSQECPGRTRQSIVKRAGKLGVACVKRCPTGRAWEPEELSFLALNYPLHGSHWEGWREGCPGRTWNGISTMARRIGLSAPGTWSEEDERALVLGIASLAKRLHRTPCAVVYHARKLMESTRRGDRQ